MYFTERGISLGRSTSQGEVILGEKYFTGISNSWGRGNSQGEVYHGGEVFHREK